MRLSELTEGRVYQVNKFSEISTVFGARVCVDVKVEQGIKRIFLPQRFQDIIPEIDSINADLGAGNVCELVYKGKLGNSGDVEIRIRDSCRSGSHDEQDR